MQIILPQGNYRELLTFKRATVIYDLTCHFVRKYLKAGDRTVDQMVQAARSGKQNIAEGVAASTTNSETEIRLVNVAKASLQELLVDYEDYLRTHNLAQWEEKGKENRWLRAFARAHEDSAPYLDIARRRDDAVVANMAIVLLKLEDYLLFRQLKALEQAFNENGDLKGRLREAAVEIRENRAKAEKCAAIDYSKKCPDCGKYMREKDHMKEGKLTWTWECPGCGHSEALDMIELIEIQRERERRYLLAKRKYDGR